MVTAAKNTTSKVNNLPKSVFAVEVKNHQLLKDAYLAYMANGRQNLAQTLKRGQVSGGGKKPWKQKGTGRARFGSSRNPIWRGGGIAFGPTGHESYNRKLNVKAKRVALKQALTLAAKANIVITTDKFETTGKVKETINLLNKLGVYRKTLVVVEKVDNLLLRSTNNLPEVSIANANKISAFEVLNADTIVITNGAVAVIEQWLGGDK